MIFLWFHMLSCMLGLPLCGWEAETVLGSCRLSAWHAATRGGIFRAQRWSRLNSPLVRAPYTCVCGAEASTGMSLDSQRARPSCASITTVQLCVNETSLSSHLRSLWFPCLPDTCWCLALHTAEVRVCLLFPKPPPLFLLPEVTEDSV